MRNKQVGPDDAADILADVVSSVTYKPGWTFELRELERGQGCEGLTLLIGAEVPDSTIPGATTSVLHLMPVLPANYGRTAWEDWIFEQIQMVETHEAMEFYSVDGVAPYFSDHGPGRNPYTRMRIKPATQPREEAVPWNGGPVTDQHFAEGGP